MNFRLVSRLALIFTGNSFPFAYIGFILCIVVNRIIIDSESIKLLPWPIILFTTKIKKMKEKSELSRHKLVSMVSQLVNDYPNPDDPQPPGPWDPVIRKAYERAALRGRAHFKFNSWDYVALNPQPLPPRVLFSQALADEVIDRVVFMQDIADGMRANGGDRSIIIVSGMISKFVDDLCPDRPKIPFPKKKGPWPPEPDPDPRWQGLELLVIGIQFQKASRTIANEGLKQNLARAAEKIISTGISRIDSLDVHAMQTAELLHES